MLLFNTDRMQRRFEPLASTTCERFRFLGICFVPVCKHTVSMKKKETQQYKCKRAKARKKEKGTTYGHRPSSDADDYTMTIR